MSDYIVRVELPNKPHGDYAGLHEDLYHAGYYTVVQGSSGKWWHLPHATYATSADGWTPKLIRAEVYTLARRSHPTPRVFVAKYDSSAWIGLQQVTVSNPAPHYP